MPCVHQRQTTNVCSITQLSLRKTMTADLFKRAQDETQVQSFAEALYQYGGI